MWGKILYLALIVLATSFHSYWRGLCDQNPIRSLDVRSPSSACLNADFARWQAVQRFSKAERQPVRQTDGKGGQPAAREDNKAGGYLAPGSRAALCPIQLHRYYIESASAKKCNLLTK